MSTNSTKWFTVSLKINDIDSIKIKYAKSKTATQANAETATLNNVNNILIWKFGTDCRFSRNNIVKKNELGFAVKDKKNLKAEVDFLINAMQYWIGIKHNEKVMKIFIDNPKDETIEIQR